jgi:hypothetical protein
MSQIGLRKVGVAEIGNDFRTFPPPVVPVMPREQLYQLYVFGISHSSSECDFKRLCPPLSPNRPVT